MPIQTDTLAFVFSTYQLGIVGVLIVVLFAPHLMPHVGRFLGRMVGMEIRRRTGISPSKVARHAEKMAASSVVPKQVPVQKTSTVAQPPAVVSRFLESAEESVPPLSVPSTPDEYSRAPDAKVPWKPWLTGICIVGAAIGVTWVLLHTR